MFFNIRTDSRHLCALWNSYWILGGSSAALHTPKRVNYCNEFSYIVLYKINEHLLYHIVMISHDIIKFIIFILYDIILIIIYYTLLYYLIQFVPYWFQVTLPGFDKGPGFCLFISLLPETTSCANEALKDWKGGLVSKDLFYFVPGTMRIWGYPPFQETSKYC